MLVWKNSGFSLEDEASCTYFCLKRVYAESLGIFPRGHVAVVSHQSFMPYVMPTFGAYLHFIVFWLWFSGIHTKMWLPHYLEWPYKLHLTGRLRIWVSFWFPRWKITSQLLLGPFLWRFVVLRCHVRMLPVSGVGGERRQSTPGACTGCQLPNVKYQVVCFAKSFSTWQR